MASPASSARRMPWCAVLLAVAQVAALQVEAGQVELGPQLDAEHACPAGPGSAPGA